MLLDLEAAVLLVAADQYPPEDWDGAETPCPIAHCQWSGVITSARCPQHRHVIFFDKIQFRELSTEYHVGGVGAEGTVTK